MLHRASVENKNECFVILDELKRRIVMTRSTSRTSKAVLEVQKASAQSVQTFQPAELAPVPDNYAPSAANIPAPQGSKDSKSDLATYLSMKRSNNRSSTFTQYRPMSSDESIYFSPALNHLLQENEHRAEIMKDIDDIICAYQTLDGIGDRRDTWAVLNGGGSGSSNRDTLAILNGGGDSKRDTADLNREALQMLRNLPPTPEEAFDATEYPAFNPKFFEQKQQQKYTHTVAAPKPLSQRPALIQSRSSGSSSIYSDSPPPSLYHHRSRSSNDSTVDQIYSTPTSYFAPSDILRGTQNPQYVPSPHGHTPLLPPFSIPQRSYTPPNAPFTESQRLHTPPLAPYTELQRPLTPPNAPFAAPQRTKTPPLPSFSFRSRPSTPIRDENGTPKTGRTRLKIVPDFDPSTLHFLTGADQPISLQPTPMFSHSNSNSHGHSPSTSFIPTCNKPLPSHPRRSHSNPTNTAPIPITISPLHTTTIASASTNLPSDPTPMTSGRPCKENNYWGFCKGAWAVREDLKRGLGVQTRPDGMYNTHQIWQCRHCHFTGETYSAPHRTKRGKIKKEMIVDPSVHVSSIGIRYRWLFLAKSHVRKKETHISLPGGRPNLTSTSKIGGDGGGGVTVDLGGGDVNYGCLVCSVEGNVTGIYGNVETLMNHVWLEHRVGMSEMTRMKSRVVCGRVAGVEEEWDLNIVDGGC